MITSVIVLPMMCYAQKQISTQYHGWYMYFGNHKLTDRISLHTEYQWRRADWIKTWQQSLLRLGVDYKINDAVSVTVGYGNIITWPYGDQPLPYKFNEHRLWEQAVVTQRVNRFYLNHRYRLEQRWLQGNGTSEENTYTFRERVRYRFLIMYPLNHPDLVPKTFFISAYDEIFAQFGKNFKFNYLDQNRLYVALGYQYSSHGNIQVGYLNQYVVKGNAIQAESNHTLQVGLTYNFDFRKHHS